MIALASDHAGFHYKEKIKQLLGDRGIEYKDFGTYSPDPSDYADYAHTASVAISRGECERGIFICGTGIGVGIVANKHRGIRAAMCQIPEAARLSRLHNNANVLTIGERLIDWETAREIVRVFLDTEFEGGRHAARIEKIHSLTDL
jgi:ribose 5-phosphate isomerase B